MNLIKNELVVGDEKDIFAKELEMVDENVLLPELMRDGEKLQAKIRYSAKEAKATLKIEGNTKKVYFEESQRAITPGQSVVLYKDDIIVGGGKIK